MRVQDNDYIVLHFKLDKYGRTLNKTFWPKLFERKPLPLVAASDQRDAGISRNTTIIAGHEFLVSKAHIITANAHHEVVSGGISKAFMERLFDRKEGFTVQYFGT